MNNNASLICLPIVIVFSLVLWLISSQEGGRILREWAAAHAYDLVEASYCSFFKGPFFLRSTKSQRVYRFVVRDQATGATRSGWARCGNWFWGVWGANDIKVIWEEQVATEKVKFKSKVKRKNDELVW